MRLIKSAVLVIVLSVTSGCSLFSSDDQEFYIPEPQLYEEALQALKSFDYVLAIDKLELLESRYPFGRYSEQAQLELIYAYYKNGSTERTLAAADRFMRLHPRHDNIDYVYYLRGLANFDADKSLTDRFLPTDPSQRDPGAARDSFADFSNLLNSYPDSQYAPDARKRMLYLKSQLADYEIHVARYYIARGALVAAANRGRYVVENYQQTDAVPAALSVMVYAYGKLGLHEAADHAQQVLDSNFPGYRDDRLPETDGEGTLLNTVTFGLLGAGPDSPRANDQPPTAKAEAAADDEAPSRSWFSTLTFGIFD